MSKTKRFEADDTTAVKVQGGAREGLQSTERDRAERNEAFVDTIGDSAEELEVLYQSAPVGLALVDRQLRYARVNDRMAEFVGLPADEMVGRTVEEVVPELAQEIVPLYQKVLDTGDPVVDREVSGVTPAAPGVTRTWVSNYRAVKVAGGGVIGVSLLTREVTESRQLQAELRQQEALLRAFMDHVPAYIYVKDSDLRHVFANRKLLDQFDLELEEFLGSRSRDFFPADMAESLETADRRVFESDRAFTLEENYSEVDNIPMWWYDIKFPISDGEGGTLIGGIGVEITELKETQAKLEERERFEALMSEASAAFVNLPIDRIDDTITTTLEQMGRHLELDRCTVELRVADGDEVRATHVWNRLQPEAVGRTYGLAEHPLLGSPIVTGEAVIWSKNDGRPIAPAEQRTIDEFCLQRFAGVPVAIGDTIAGAFAVSSSTDPGPWPDGLADRLDLLAHLVGNVLARRQRDQELRDALALNEELRFRLEQDNAYLREKDQAVAANREIVGESDAMLSVLRQAEQVAATDSTVLIEGETGTGKELLAQHIHRTSGRKARTMMTVNCGALPDSLVESELFGREKGAYTGALSRQIGRFEAAGGSTLLLDEVGDLPAETQVKLLRVLETGEFERLGSTKTLKTDVRVIAATNRDLAQLVREDSFREDLYYRLAVFPITVPPLRERPEDIPLLVWKFVKTLADQQGKHIDVVPRPTMRILCEQRWPGNVRELRNIIERAVILTTSRTLTVQLPNDVSAEKHPSLAMDDVQRRHIEEVLERTRNRIRGPGGAAEILGMKPSTLYDRMKKLGIERPKG